MTQKKDSLAAFWKKNQIVEEDRSNNPYNSTSPRRLLPDDVSTLMDMMDNINEGGRVRWLELVSTLREFCSIRCINSNKIFRERYGLTVKHAYNRRIKKKEKHENNR